jgi:hypothetical protein
MLLMYVMINTASVWPTLTQGFGDAVPHRLQRTLARIVGQSLPKYGLKLKRREADKPAAVGLAFPSRPSGPPRTTGRTSARACAPR